MQNCPLVPGAASLHFLEDPEGIPLSENIEKFLNSSSIADMQRRNDVLALRYLVNVEINSPVEDKETIQDLRYALALLDKASLEYRSTNNTDPVGKVQESARRIFANLCIKGIFDTKDYAQEFDTCCLDLSEVPQDNLEKNLIFLAQIAQRTNPTVYIIPTSIANRLDGELKETSLGKTLNAKVKMRSVFANTQKGDLKNWFVRAI